MRSHGAIGLRRVEARDAPSIDVLNVARESILPEVIARHTQPSRMQILLPLAQLSEAIDSIRRLLAVASELGQAIESRQADLVLALLLAKGPGVSHVAAAIVGVRSSIVGVRPAFVRAIDAPIRVPRRVAIPISGVLCIGAATGEAGSSHQN